MSINISKNAINNIPLTEDSVGDDNGGRLNSLLLRNSKYLISLAKNNVTISPLKSGMENEAVRLIKVALNFINDRNDIYPNYTIVPLDVTSYQFDTNLYDAIVAFQNWSEIAITGTVNSETLLAIDSKFTGKEFFDASKKKYIGEISDVQFSIQQEKSLVNNKYYYSIFFVGEQKEFNIELDRPIKGKGVKNSVDNIDEFNFVPDESSKSEILKNPDVRRYTDGFGIDKSNFSFSMKREGTKFIFDKVEIPIGDYNSEEESTPPHQFDDPNAKLHKMQSSDTPTKIVLDNYYGGGGYHIMDPYNTNTVIYTLPERTPFPVEKRSEDARFQFYINLLYYYNSEDKGAGVKEWGLKKANGYERYSIDHLNEVNIFDNSYDAGDPNTGLPNYYRFLKRMEGLNPNSKILFDTAGNATSFTTVEGKNIIIPSRQFADSMYYFLNYRHNEMLVPVVIPGWLGASPRTKMEYVVGQVLEDIIETVTDAIDNILGIAAEVKSDAIELYNEAADFFQKVYNFAINVLTDYWPRGAGGKLGLGASVTWGIPIQTKGNVEKSLSRKTTQQNELTLNYSTELILGIGVNASEGFSVGFGKYSGHGKSKKTLGIDVGANVSAGYDVIVATEYEFPIRQDETALLVMIVNVFGGTLVQSTAEILNYLNIVELDPRQYISKFEVAIEGNASGKIGAAVGLNNDQGIQMPGSNSDYLAVQDSTKSYGFIDNIFSKLPGLGVQGELDFKGGVGFSYEVDYGSNPFTTKHEGRVFETIEIDNKLHIQTTLSTGLMGSFFQKLFFNSVPLVSSFADTIFSLLSFDVGLLLGTHYKFERTTSPDLIDNSDFSFGVIDTAALALTGNSALIYETDHNRVKKEVSLYFGTFTGDVDSLCEPGTEVKYHIDMGILYKMWKERDTYVYNFDNTFALFKSIEYRKKVGAFNFDTSKIKKIVEKKNNDNGLTKQVVDAHKKGNQNNREIKLTSALLAASLENIGSENFFVSGGLALDLKMEIKLALLKKIFEFYFKKLYLKYEIKKADPNARNKIDNEVVKKEEEIIAIIKAEGITILNGEVYYDRLYTDLLAFIEQKIITESGSNTFSYMEAINQFIKGINLYNLYMNGIVPKTKEDLDHGITKIIDAFSFITNIGQLEATLEAKAGLGFGGSITAGLGETVGISLDAMAEINYQGILYKNGEFTDLLNLDPLYVVYEEIRKTLGLPSTNKQIGAKTVFGVLKK